MQKDVFEPFWGKYLSSIMQKKSQSYLQDGENKIVPGHRSKKFLSPPHWSVVQRNLVPLKISDQPPPLPSAVNSGHSLINALSMQFATFI